MLSILPDLGNYSDFLVLLTMCVLSVFPLMHFELFVLYNPLPNNWNRLFLIEQSSAIRPKFQGCEEGIPLILRHIA